MFEYSRIYCANKQWLARFIEELAYGKGLNLQAMAFNFRVRYTDV